MNAFPAAARFLQGFATNLRVAGFPVAPEQVADFMQAVTLLGPRSMKDIYRAGVATLAPGAESLDTFDSLFRAYFEEGHVQICTLGDGDDEKTKIKDDGGVTGESPEPRERDDSGRRAASTERLGVRGFTPNSLQLHRFSRRLSDAMPTRRSFRTRPDRTGGQPDLRRSLRDIVRLDGDISQPWMRNRQIRQRRLVLLIDISGSMKNHTDAHLRVAHAVVQGADHAEVFTLGTRLTRITTPLKISNRVLALERVSSLVDDWDGGTRLGPTLESLLEIPRFAGFLRGAAIVILSDGLERGDPDTLVRAIAHISGRSWRLSLCTPLAADSRFRPKSAALGAALPYLDDLVEGGSVESLTGFLIGLAQIGSRAEIVWRRKVDAVHD